MLKPLHRHLIYYKTTEWARLEWGHLLSRGAGNKFIQSQSSQGENLCQQDAFCHSLEQEYLKAMRLFSSPSTSPQFPLSSLRVFNYFNLYFHAGETQVPR